jgi:hypothetical protein
MFNKYQTYINRVNYSPMTEEDVKMALSQILDRILESKEIQSEDGRLLVDDEKSETINALKKSLQISLY